VLRRLEMGRQEFAAAMLERVKRAKDVVVQAV
jgi:hypothetical protein